MKRLFLGVDGGQSHTEALVADADGNILGRGLGGPSNHAEQPGGRERLRSAVIDSVTGALSMAGIGSDAIEFESAHFGMTGGADFKEEVISAAVKARTLRVGHDAPTALFGATGGEPGIVVIAGTGSVVYGENAAGETARAGGLGYLFSDEGSGFWIATEAIRIAIREQDGVIPAGGLESLVLEFFGVDEIRKLTTPFYNGLVTRERIASFAKRIADEAANGSELPAAIIRRGAGAIVANIAAVAKRLGFDADFTVSGVGGVFRGSVFHAAIVSELAIRLPRARFCEPLFGPATGALLLAYRSARIELNASMLSNLKDNKIR